MRIAALIFGLLAGLAAGLMLALGDIETHLAVLPALAPWGTLIARLLVYLVPAIGWIGAGLVLARPRFGGGLLLLSAAGWAGLAFAAGHGAVLFAALPFTFAAAAGIVALFRRGSADRRALPERRPDPERPAPTQVAGKPPARRLAEPPTLPDRATNRHAATTRTRIVEPSAAPIEAAFPPLIPPPFQDDVVMDDAPPTGVPEEAAGPIAAATATLAAPPAEKPAAGSMEAPPPPETSTTLPAGVAGESRTGASTAEPAAAKAAEPTNRLAASGDPDAAALRARRPGDWSLPAPAAPSRTRYAAEQQSVPLTRTTSVSVTIDPGAADAPQRPLPIEPVAAAIAAPAAEPGAEPVRPPPRTADEPPEAVEASAAALDFAPPDDYGRGNAPPPGQSQPAAASVAETRERLRRRTRRDPDAVPDAPARRRRGGIRAVLRGVIAAAFVVVLLGAGGAIYLDYLRGPHSLLFGHRPAAKAASAAKPAPTPLAAPSEKAPAPSIPAAPAASPAAAPSAPSPASARPVPPSAAASPAKTETSTATATADPAPAAPAAPAAPTFTDPVRYCATVRNIDAPDSHYTGPAVPPAVATALLLPKSAPATGVHWRCAGGVALACNANGTHACDLTPTVQHMLDYCAKHPGAGAMPAPNGSWSCNGTRPVIPEDQSWPVDSRGFYPDAWVRVSPMGAG